MTLSHSISPPQSYTVTSIAWVWIICNTVNKKYILDYRSILYWLYTFQQCHYFSFLTFNKSDIDIGCPSSKLQGLQKTHRLQKVYPLSKNTCLTWPQPKFPALDPTYCFCITKSQIEINLHHTACYLLAINAVQCKKCP